MRRCASEVHCPLGHTNSPPHHLALTPSTPHHPPTSTPNIYINPPHQTPHQPQTSPTSTQHTLAQISQSAIPRAQAPRVSSVFPISDSSAGGRPLTLRGSGLLNGSHVLCQFRGRPRAVRHAVHPCDRCRRWRVAHLCLPQSRRAAPASRGDAHVSLELRVSLNAQQYTACVGADPHHVQCPPPLDFAVIAGGGDTTPILLDVLPSLGPVNGSTSVLVSGLRMQTGTRYLCSFGGSVVSGSYDGRLGAVRCLTPPHAAGSVALSVSFNGEHYHAQTFPFSFYSQVSLDAVSPSAGPPTASSARATRAPAGRSSALSSLSLASASMRAADLFTAAASTRPSCRPRCSSTRLPLPPPCSAARLAPSPPAAPPNSRSA